MANVKVQHIHWCIQCEEKLPTKCAKCVKHPDRKPRMVEIFDAPKILQTNACGCVGFRCQNPKCPTPHKLVWRHPRADGTLGYKNHFCTHACTVSVTMEARKATRVNVPCSCGCGRICMRRPCELRTRHVYFSQKCHFAHRIKLKAEERRRASGDDDSLQLFICNSKRPCCLGNNGTDHVKQPNGKYRCVRCNFVEDAPSYGVSSINKDAAAIKLASKALAGGAR